MIVLAVYEKFYALISSALGSDIEHMVSSLLAEGAISTI